MGFFESQFGQNPDLGVLIPLRLRPDLFQVDEVAVPPNDWMDAFKDSLEPLVLLFLLSNRVEVINPVEFEF